MSGGGLPARFWWLSLNQPPIKIMNTLQKEKLVDITDEELMNALPVILCGVKKTKKELIELAEVIRKSLIERKQEEIDFDIDIKYTDSFKCSGTITHNETGLSVSGEGKSKARLRITLINKLKEQIGE